MTTLGERLLADHERMEELFEELIANVHCGEMAVMTEAWTKFERALLAHMDFEERLLLRDFAARHPTEARAIHEEHEAIRTELDLLWVELQLHLMRETRARDFVRRLQEHAERETRLLYPWASARHAAAHEHLHA